ncbi:uncharacterized protein METZ01_LOCUS459198, partial [marine metagenome]
MEIPPNEYYLLSDFYKILRTRVYFITSTSNHLTENKKDDCIVFREHISLDGFAFDF